MDLEFHTLSCCITTHTSAAFPLSRLECTYSHGWKEVLSRCGKSDEESSWEERRSF